jgi:hypothetical protein
LRSLNPRWSPFAPATVTWLSAARIFFLSATPPARWMAAASTFTKSYEYIA